MKRTFILWILFLICQLSYGQNGDLTEENVCNLKVANALTPNDADKLYVSCLCEIKSFSFELYDRWGKEVYATTSLANYLDINLSETENVDGKDKPKFRSGTYFWIAKYKVSIGGATITKINRGNLSIYLSE